MKTSRILVAVVTVIVSIFSISCERFSDLLDGGLLGDRTPCYLIRETRTDGFSPGTYEYDSLGRVIRILNAYGFYNPNTGLEKGRHFLTYYKARWVIDSIAPLDPTHSQKKTYFLNAQGLADSSSFVARWEAGVSAYEYERTAYTYNANKNLIRSVTSKGWYDELGLDTIWIAIDYTYTSGNLMSEHIVEKSGGTPTHRYITYEYYPSLDTRNIEAAVGAFKGKRSRNLLKGRHEQDLSGTVQIQDFFSYTINSSGKVTRQQWNHITYGRHFTENTTNSYLCR